MNPAIIIASVIIPPIIIFYIAMFFIRKSFAQKEENERIRLNIKVLKRSSDYLKLIKDQQKVKIKIAVNVYPIIQWINKNMDIAARRGFSQKECEDIIKEIDREEIKLIFHLEDK